MLTNKIQLWSDQDDVNLFAYILDNSQEFNNSKKRPAVIICPGGAYLGTSDREAEPVAMRFSAIGYHAFVLRYNTYFSNKPLTDFMNFPTEVNVKSTFPQPLLDLAKAIITIREKENEWLIDSDRIAICGFSAGAHLAATIGTHWQDEFLREKFDVDNSFLKPNALILGYPLLDYVVMKEEVQAAKNDINMGLWEISNKAVFGETSPSEEDLEKNSPINYITSYTPPTFIWHTADDELVYVSNSLKFALALTKHKVPYELHIFESGVHGLSLCDETTASEPYHINPNCKVWFDMAVSWIKRHFAES